MFRLHKRMTALLVALAMLTISLGAMAQDTVPPTPQSVYERGNTLKSELGMTINQEAVSAFLGSFMGGEGDEAAAQMSVINLLVGAVNKMQTTTLSNTTAGSVSIGTPEGELLDLQVGFGADGAHITSSILPGLRLALPKEMLDTLLNSQQISAQMPQISEDMLKPYGEAVQQYFAGEVLAAAQMETGTFDLPEVGMFSSRIDFPITTHTMAGLVNAVSAVLKDDLDTQMALDMYLNQMNTAMQAAPEAVEEMDLPETSMRSAADLLAAMDTMQAELLENAALTVANQTLYQGDVADAFYSITQVMTEEGTPMARVTILSVPNDTASNVKVGILLRSEDTATPGEVDWDALKAQIVSGMGDGAMYMDLAVNNTKDAATNERIDTLNMEMNVEGMLINIQANGRTALAGDYASTGEVQIGFMGISPVLTLHANLSEVKDIPLPVAEGGSVIAFSENMSQADQTLLENALQQALPALLERLQVALPQEAPIILMMLQPEDATITAVP